MTYTAQPGKSQFGFPQGHTNAAGTWERNGSDMFSCKIPIDYTLADATVLYTVPIRARLIAAYWEITADWTGGSSSAIGLSSSKAPHNTKGDIHGGASGDVAATLVASAGVVRGTQGLSVTATPFVVVLEAADTIKFDRITSAFTAGTGYVHLEWRVVG